MKQFVYCLVFCVLLRIESSFGTLPSILPTTCSRSDPNFERCVKGVVELIRPNIASGNYGPGQPKAPALEPIFIDKMLIDNGPSFRAKMSNVTIKGAGGFLIGRISLNLAEKAFNVSVKLPSMVVDGKYTLDMQLLLLRITGQGDFNLRLDDTLCNLKLKYFFTRGADGKESVQFQPIQVRLKFVKGRFNLQNLFNGDPTLGQVGNNVINEDPLVLLEEVRPAFEQSLGKIFTAIANSAISGASELELLPL
ncbi:putative beta-carotene-binding protein [Malaya genurostris]|uniref:putative beta-carotene-binding protein n=1 Tax=Malaya genurostris TaxID=325434 RepID=UPI0026F3EA6B|nr:putative beta-carotene-binding protein [Malaya genurostris]